MKRVIPSSRRGFTMIELIVAMVLIAGVMIGLNTFIFSMSELWGRGREYRLFDQHARSLTRFLEGELRQAALPPRVAKDVAAVEAREVEVDLVVARICWFLDCGRGVEFCSGRSDPCLTCGPHWR